MPFTISNECLELEMPGQAFFETYTNNLLALITYLISLYDYLVLIMLHEEMKHSTKWQRVNSEDRLPTNYP